jgi:hypothetical protein
LHIRRWTDHNKVKRATGRYSIILCYTQNYSGYSFLKIYSLLIHLAMLSVPQIRQYQMMGWWVNAELERMWKKLLVVWLDIITLASDWMNWGKLKNLCLDSQMRLLTPQGWVAQWVYWLGYGADIQRMRILFRLKMGKFLLKPHAVSEWTTWYYNPG